jgi:hypothetical protein
MAEATDGDGLAMGPILIRLHGIDAPESGQKCSRAGGGTWSCDEAALDHLAGLVDGERVACTALERDPTDGSSRGAARAISTSRRHWSGKVSPGHSPGTATTTSTPRRSACSAPGHLAGRHADTVGLPGEPLGPTCRGVAARRVPHQGQHQRVGRTNLPHPLVEILRPHEDRRVSRRALVLRRGGGDANRLATAAIEVTRVLRPDADETVIHRLPFKDRFRFFGRKQAVSWWCPTTRPVVAAPARTARQTNGSPRTAEAGR